MNARRLLPSLIYVCGLVIAQGATLAYAQPSTPIPKKAAQPAPTLTDVEKQNAINELRAKHLTLPIAGFDVNAMKGSFEQTRGGTRHGAADMLAPRNTPVMAVEDGTIVKLFLSKPGGITIYQGDPSNKFVYYYAHLEKYAENLHDGDKVKKGQVIGYVGTSGNAPPNTPHLHFAIGVGDAQRNWWQTADLDPYEIFK